jgi:NAD(P)-dependent dehydrogenase (short-subunit alcohol dehydrogenase family)
MKQSVLITGAASGIGWATAKLLASKGYRIILLDRNAPLMKSARDELMQRGGTTEDIDLVELDLGDIARLESWADNYPFPGAGLFGLINNAAIENLKPMVDLSVQDLDAMWRINMLAPVVLARKCLPHLKRCQGSIVNVGSIADRAYSRLYSGYGASKAFLNSFFKHAAKEIGFEGVRVNSVSPGSVDTPLMDDVLARGLFDPKDVTAEVAGIPLEQRLARPEEIAQTILFALTGPRYLHGADLRIHGGSNP